MNKATPASNPIFSALSGRSGGSLDPCLYPSRCGLAPRAPGLRVALFHFSPGRGVNEPWGWNSFYNGLGNDSGNDAAQSPAVPRTLRGTVFRCARTRRARSSFAGEGICPEQNRCRAESRCPPRAACRRDSRPFGRLSVSGYTPHRANHAGDATQLVKENRDASFASLSTL